VYNRDTGAEGGAVLRRGEVRELAEEYLSIDEAAAELDIGRSTIWKWIRRHEIPTFRVLGDRRTLIKRSDLARLQEPIPIDPTKKEAA
jgi:excisionase family DNA binding protein